MALCLIHRAIFFTIRYMALINLNELLQYSQYKQGNTNEKHC